MRAFLRVALTGIGLVLILTALALLIFSQQVQAGLRKGLEWEFGRLLDTDVEIDSLSFSSRRQGMMLQNVRVASPEDYETGPAMRFTRIIVVPELTTLFSDEPHLREVRLEEPILRLAYRPGVGTNLGELLEAFEANRASMRLFDRNVVVERLRAQETQCVLEAAGVPLPSVTLPATELENLARDTFGPGWLMRAYLAQQLEALAESETLPQALCAALGSLAEAAANPLGAAEDAA